MTNLETAQKAAETAKLFARQTVAAASKVLKAKTKPEADQPIADAKKAQQNVANEAKNARGAANTAKRAADPEVGEVDAAADKAEALKGKADDAVRAAETFRGTLPD